jgi:TonB family protein
MRNILRLLIVVFSIVSYAYTAKAQEPVYDFVSIKKQPEFPGGMIKLFKYIKGEVKNSKSTKTGKVFLSFIVEEDGSLTNMKITRSLGKEEDEEALEIMRKSPKWIPGEHNGKIVRVKYALNINFNRQ